MKPHSDTIECVEGKTKMEQKNSVVRINEGK